MEVLLKTVDQIPGKGTYDGPALRFTVGTVTAREIVVKRVIEEVARYNGDDELPAHISLVTPAAHERALNGARRERRPPLDPGRQVEVALAAVRSGRVIILFNGEQVTDID